MGCTGRRGISVTRKRINAGCNLEAPVQAKSTQGSSYAPYGLLSWDSPATEQAFIRQPSSWCISVELVAQEIWRTNVFHILNSNSV